jgi:hypothetical protein
MIVVIETPPCTARPRLGFDIGVAKDAGVGYARTASTSLRDNRAECKLANAASKDDAGRQPAEDRAVRRQLLIGPGRDQGAGAMVRHLAG